MATIEIEYYADAKQNKNIYGSQTGGHEDTTTTTSAETDTIPAGSVIVSAFAAEDHYIGFGSGSTSSASTRKKISAGQRRDFEIPTAFTGGGTLEYKSAS